jgi:hypothetical protein
MLRLEGSKLYRARFNGVVKKTKTYTTVLPHTKRLTVCTVGYRKWEYPDGRVLTLKSGERPPRPKKPKPKTIYVRPIKTVTPQYTAPAMSYGRSFGGMSGGSFSCAGGG